METLHITFSNLALTQKYRFAIDGQQAIDICRQETSVALENCDDMVLIVILDETMPRKTGIEAIQEIRAFIEHLNATRHTNEIGCPESALRCPFLRCSLPNNLRRFAQTS